MHHSASPVSKGEELIYINNGEQPSLYPETEKTRLRKTLGNSGISHFYLMF